MPEYESVPICKGIKFGDEQFVNKSKTATTLVYSSPNDPLSPEGNIWLNQARLALDETANAEVYGIFAGTPVDSWDSINAVSHFFPIIIGVSGAVVLGTIR